MYVPFHISILSMLKRTELLPDTIYVLCKHGNTITLQLSDKKCTCRTQTFLKNRDREPFLSGLPAGLAAGLVAADWTVRVPVSVCADSGCSVAAPCPVTLTWTGMKVIPPLSLAIPAEVRVSFNLKLRFTCHSSAQCFQHLTLHRYGDRLPVVGGDCSSRHGDHSLPSWDGRDQAGLTRLGHVGRCCTGGAGGAGGGDPGVAIHWVDEQTTASRAGGGGAVTVQQGGGGGGHACVGGVIHILIYFHKVVFKILKDVLQNKVKNQQDIKTNVFVLN